MKKLIYLSAQEIHDKTSWSGTIYKMYQTLSKEYDITEVVIKDSIIDKCFDLFMRIITLNKVKKYPIKDLFKIKKLKRILNKYPNIPIFAPICSGLIAMLKDSNKKFIYLSDAVYENMVGFYNNDSKLLVNKNNSLQKQALELSSQIIFSSSRPIATTTSFYGIDMQKLNVIKFGANLSDHYKAKDQLGNTVKLLIVGVDYERKGIKLAIETVQYLNKVNDNRKFELHIIGFNTPQDINDSNIIFHGHLNKNDSKEEQIICSIYEECDIFILPSIANCSPIVLCEASMYGLPSISFNVGGIKDYLENDYNGVLLEKTKSIEEISNAVLKVIDNYDAYSKNARNKYLNELNWETWLNEFNNIYKKINN